MGKRRKKALEPRVCKNCQKPYPPTRDWQEYCSTRCRKEAWHRKQSSVGHTHPDIVRRLERLEKALGIQGQP